MGCMVCSMCVVHTIRHTRRTIRHTTRHTVGSCFGFMRMRCVITSTLVQCRRSCIECLQAHNSVDDNGWLPVTHAIDCSSFSRRAFEVAKHMITQHIHYGPYDSWVFSHKTTGKQPRSWSLLHFVADGSDVQYRRHELVGLLIYARADVDPTNDKLKTPFELACASGNVNTARELIFHGADTSYAPQGRAGPLQTALCSSSQMTNMLRSYGVAVKAHQWVHECHPPSCRKSWKKLVRHSMHDPDAHGEYWSPGKDQRRWAERRQDW